MIIHKVNSFDELEKYLEYFKNNNYGYISYITGEYGIVINYYKTFAHKFYLELNQRNIKTVGFCFKNTTSFLYDCCDEIIEYQDIDFNNDDNTNNSCINNNNIEYNEYKIYTTSYNGNDGWSVQYIRGIKNDNYEDLINKMNFESIFYTLHLDGSNHYNKQNGYKGIGYCNHINLYKLLNNENIYYIPDHYTTNPYAKPMIINDKTKKRCVAIWIRNTNKHPFRNTKPETYNTVFNYCIANNITCYVFLDLQPIELPESIFIKNCTDRFKNRPNWDNFLNVLSNCDFYIGSDSGSSEIVLLNIKMNCLFDNYYEYHLPHTIEISNKNKQDGYICENIDFPSRFSRIMNDFYL